MRLLLAAVTLGLALTLTLNAQRGAPVPAPINAPAAPSTTDCPATDWAGLDRSVTEALTRWTSAGPRNYTFTHRLLGAHDITTRTVTVQAGQVTRVQDEQGNPLDLAQDRSIEQHLRALQETIRTRGQLPHQEPRCILVDAEFNPETGAPTRWSWQDATGGLMDVAVWHEVLNLRPVDAAR